MVSAYQEENRKFSGSARSLAALAFMPEQDVQIAFDELITDEDFDHRVQPIADYFEDTWIGRPVCRGPRRAPLFPINLWNVCQRTVNGERRTNNNIKECHRQFQSTGGCSRTVVLSRWATAWYYNE